LTWDRAKGQPWHACVFPLSPWVEDGPLFFTVEENRHREMNLLGQGHPADWLPNPYVSRGGQERVDTPSYPGMVVPRERLQ
jgi:hypothetical protein